ncbi:MAG: riboflavin synthase [Candidatus Margulisiibacteriota bacterium]
MFTGLVKETGKIVKISPLGKGIEVDIACTKLFSDDITIGDSINVNGVCSTAIKTSENGFTVQYLEETLKKTTMAKQKVNDILNLEPCLTLQTKLGGHLVSGHVDDTGTIASYSKDGQWGVLVIEFSNQFAPFVIPKGSIAIDGISLTIVDLTQNTLSCHLIPHTQNHTSLKTKRPGDQVNLEFDQVGKYLFRFHELDRLN